MSPDALLIFLKEEQKDYLAIEECTEIVKNFESSEDKSSFTNEGFTHFLMFNDWQVNRVKPVPSILYHHKLAQSQELLSPISRSRVKAEEMVHPLSHYWIASSHNT